MPLATDASFMSSILGKEVSASNNLSFLQQNSQNGLALEVNFSSFAMIDNKKNSGIDESIEIAIVAGTALLPVTGPSGVASDGVEEESYSLEKENLDIYVVRKGDSVAQVAEMFGITADTIYSANDMKKGDKLKEGDVLLILPFSGVEHETTKGQTLQGIANLYKISVEDIISANDIDEGAKVAVGEKLMVPGANMLSEVKPKAVGTIKAASNIIAKTGSTVSSVAGYFSKPVPGSVKSRGVKPGHKGVDFAAPTGTPIIASASGAVLIARSGWNGGFGTYVVMSHPNGTKTLYAHMSRLNTSPGAKVSQGQVIGYVGNTGRSTGPHTHFEIWNAKNPF